MVNAIQFRNQIVQPALKSIDLASPEAVMLLMGIAAHESHLGEYLIQQGHEDGVGTAKGPWQMEDQTFEYTMETVRDRSDIIAASDDSFYLRGLTGSSWDPRQMVGNWYLACVMARCYLLTEPTPIPTDPDKHPEYWIDYWNRGTYTQEERETLLLQFWDDRKTYATRLDYQS